MRLWHRGLIILCCVCLFCICLHRRRFAVLKISPGITWRCGPFGRSKLVDEEIGVIAEGCFNLIVCDYGLCVDLSGRKEPIYVDLMEHRVIAFHEAGTNLWDKCGVVFSTDALSATGVYCKQGKSEFDQAISNLLKRVNDAKAKKHRAARRSDDTRHE